jgi:uncharacterized membrane protein (UPF0182 family)
MEIIDTILGYARQGFDQVNAVQGLIIALIAAFILPSWRRLPMIVVGATAVHVAADVLLPVLTGDAVFRLPDVLELPFWRYVATLLIGYLVVIAVFALIKRLVLKR